LAETAERTASRPLRTEEVIPAAARTISSLRDVGYELPQAVADLVDNSIAAQATRVSIDLPFEGDKSWIRISDNGLGMDAATLTEALRYGTERDYSADDLGKFGFGLKTASTSQCRRVTVASRRSLVRARIEARALDLDHIEQTNRWEILVVDAEDRPLHLTEPLQTTTGTVVLWEKLDRILDYADPWGGWARRKLLTAAEAIAEHLGMVFHRFLSGEVAGQKMEILVNGSRVAPWDPFCREEQKTITLDFHDFAVASGSSKGIVHVKPYVLPDKTEFSDPAAWQRASGPLKWNRQQGLYIYRANRLIQWGGWSRMRTIDEHSKLARVAVDFMPNLDSAFGINISKAIVEIPADLHEELEPIINQVVRIATQRYRKGGDGKGPRRPNPPSPSPFPPLRPQSPSPPPCPPSPAPEGIQSQNDAGQQHEPGGTNNRDGGFWQPPLNPQPTARAIEEAAREAGEQAALQRIIASLRRTAPEVARDLGW
jgi:hypothetical protein